MFGAVMSQGETFNNLTCLTFHEISYRFRERNTTIYSLPYGKSLQFYEPCNGASNFAYYHMIPAMRARTRWTLAGDQVRGLAQTCAALGLGSAFFHGSHTRLGARCDSN